MKIDIKQLQFIDPILREILMAIEKSTGMEMTITSLYRMDDPGVHGTLPLRGTDLRCRSVKVGGVIEELINSKWQYDPVRPHMQCVVLHGKGGNLHLHVQVHPNTRRL